MRGGCWVLLLVAGGLSACSGQLHQPDATAIGPSVVERHAVETDEAAVDDEITTDLARRDEATLGDPARGSARTSRDVAANRGTTGSDATAGARTPRFPTRPSDDATGPATDGASDDDTATSAADTPASTGVAPRTRPRPTLTDEPSGRRRRSSFTPDLWLWIAGGVLALVALGAFLRRWRARARLRRLGFDGDEAWEVFQARLGRSSLDDGAAG